MLAFWEIRIIPSLPLLPDPIRPGVVAQYSVLSMGRIELNCVLMRNRIPWNVVFTDKKCNCSSLLRTGISCAKNSWTYEGHPISFQTFFVWALLLIVHSWTSSPLPSNLLWLQGTCCTVLTTSGRPHGRPLVWACQWPSLKPLSSPQLSHNDSLWA